jgi:hypothetical protein
MNMFITSMALETITGLRTWSFGANQEQKDKYPAREYPT